MEIVGGHEKKTLRYDAYFVEGFEIFYGNYESLCLQKWSVFFLYFGSHLNSAGNFQLIDTNNCFIKNLIDNRSFYSFSCRMVLGTKRRCCQSG